MLAAGLASCTGPVETTGTGDAAKAALRCAPSGSLRGFEDTFSLGETCGREVELEAALRMADQVPEALRATYLDGVGHGLSKVPEDARALAAQIRSLAPMEAQPMLHDGVIRAWTESQRGEPDRVLPWVQDYLRQTGHEDGRNGVRVGLQRSRGGDLAEAVQLALRYPSDWHPALLEELGWRAGNDAARGGPAPPTYAAALTRHERCTFLRGAARGWSMKHPWVDAQGWALVEEPLKAWPAECQRDVAAGLAWALVILHPEAPRRRAGLEAISDPALQAGVEEALRRAQEPAQEPIWGG